MTDDFALPEDAAEDAAEAELSEVDPRTGLAWGAIALFAGVGLSVVFALQNTQTVAIQFLWFDGSFPLSIVILATAAISILLFELFGVVYRRRRRLRKAEKEELRRLRGDA